jgi:molybdate transport system regulatory protein
VIAVAASGRKTGKTLLACRIASGMREAGLSVCFAKMRRRTGGPVSVTRSGGAPSSDTERVRNAGARTSVLVEFSLPDSAAAALEEEAEGSDALILESNSLAGTVEADLLVYLDAGGKDRKNPELRCSADLLAEAPLDADAAGLLAETAMALLHLGAGGFRVRGKHWIERNGTPVLGGGRAGLLEAVRSEGSILGAARATGIPYKRAWVHIREAEESLGARLILPVRGGAGGGGTRLSELGERLLSAYRRAEAQLQRELEGTDV